MSNEIQNIYLSPRGRDTNQGTRLKPLKTISQAWQLGCELALSKPVFILIEDGTYYLKETLLLERIKTPDTIFPITIMPLPGAKPAFSGSKKLVLKWEKYSDQVYKADLSEQIGDTFDQLFMNGKRQIMARYPSGNPLSPLLENFVFIEGADERIFPEGKDSDAMPPLPHKEIYYSDDQFSKNRWQKPEEAIIHIFPRENWNCLQFRIRGIDYEERKIFLGEGGFQQHERFARRPGTDFDQTSRFYIENVFEELNTPGEWYFDRSCKTLFYYPVNESDLKEAVFEVPLLKELIRFEGTENNPCQGVHIKGLRFTGTRRTFFDKYEIPSFGDWKIVRSGAIFLKNSKDCSIDDCFIDSVGGNGIFLDGFNKRITIKNCLITECGESGIALVGASMLTRDRGYNCSFCGKHHSWSFKEHTKNYSSECLIENNLIHDIGVWGKQTAALFLAVSKGNHIKNNEFFNIPRAALCIHDGTYGGHIIEHNYMHHTCRDTDEHGTFNSWGRDSWWCLSQSHEGQSHPAGNVLYDAKETVILRNNRFLDFKGWGIDLDDGSSNYDIYNNVCLGVGIKNREGDFRKVHNNIVYLPTISKPTAIQVGCEENSDGWYNNIIYAEQDPIHLTIPPRKGKPVKICDHNVYFSRQGFFSSRGMSFADWKKLGMDEHSVFADPQFIDTELGNFTVSDNSPALKSGFENFPQDKYGLVEFPETWRSREPHYPVYNRDTMNREMLKNLRKKNKPISPDENGHYTLDEEYGRTQSPKRYIWNLQYVNGGIFQLIVNYQSDRNRSFSMTSFVESIGINSLKGELSAVKDPTIKKLGKLSLSGEDTDVIKITFEVESGEGPFRLIYARLIPC